MSFPGCYFLASSLKVQGDIIICCFQISRMLAFLLVFIESSIWQRAYLWIIEYAAYTFPDVTSFQIFVISESSLNQLFFKFGIGNSSCVHISRMLTFLALQWKFKGDSSCLHISHYQHRVFFCVFFERSKKILFKIIISYQAAYTFPDVKFGRLHWKFKGKIFIKFLCCLHISSMLIFVRHQWKFNQLTKEIQATHTKVISRMLTFLALQWKFKGDIFINMLLTHFQDVSFFARLHGKFKGRIYQL